MPCSFPSAATTGHEGKTPPYFSPRQLTPSVTSPTGGVGSAAVYSLISFPLILYLTLNLSGTKADGFFGQIMIGLNETDGAAFGSHEYGVGGGDGTIDVHPF